MDKYQQYYELTVLIKNLERSLLLNTSTELNHKLKMACDETKYQRQILVKLLEM